VSIDSWNRSTVMVMAAARTATEADHAEVARIFLEDLAQGAPLDDSRRALRPFVDFAFRFSGDVLTEIAALGLAVAGVAPATPSLTNATERYLAERPVSGNGARQKHRAAMQVDTNRN
jgi:hypothetical protein